MASEISWRHTATGKTLYATIRAAARTMWNTSGSALEALTVANWGDYDIALTETPASSYFYVGSWPAGLTTAGWYWIDVYVRKGGSPAISDTLAGGLVVYWNGTVANPWSADVTQVGGTVQTAGDLAGKIGTPVAIDGGTASIAGMLTKLADDGGGSVFDATNDSLNKIKTAVSGTLTANVTQISGDTTAADRLEAMLDATPTGTVAASPSPTASVFKTDLSEATDDHYNAAFVVFTSGALLGESRKISDYDGTSKTITVATAFTEAPSAADAFLIIGRSE